MRIQATPIKDLLIIEPRVFPDSRGYFFESYNEKQMYEAGIQIRFVQDNQSKSTKGVLRGLHYQLNPFAQTKLLRVLQGTVVDVAVDIRNDSITFGKSFAIELSCENKLQLLIPKGFAHGFSVLSDTAIVLYKCDSFYNPSAERGILFSDPALKIDWGFDIKSAIVSHKDMQHALLKDAEMNF